MFADARISLWREQLPEVDNSAGRVRAVIDLLRDKRNTTQQNGLVLLLQVLADQSTPEDACHHDLTTLAEALASRAADSDGLTLPITEGVYKDAYQTVYHNLPQPDYGRFIGREEELAKVARILRPYPHSQHAIVTIDGIGGIGKSALALEIAHRYLRDYEQIAPGERFEAIIWTSAKQSVLTAEGIKVRRQVLRTLKDIYTTIAVTLEREDITRAHAEEQDNLVRKALTRQRTLLIVDNLETVDDEAVLDFIREIPAPTKVMVTTRHRIDVAYPIRLMGMPEQDGLALIALECQKKGVELNTEQSERLFERTGGVPLAIVWSIALMGHGYSVESVLHRLGEPQADISRFCFEQTVARIKGTPAYRLMLTLALFVTDASRAALGYIADLPELDRDDGLAVLERLSLLNKEGNRFKFLPLTRGYALAQLNQLKALKDKLQRGQIEYYQAFIAQHSLGSQDSLALISEERENLSALLDFLVMSDEFDIVVEIFDRYYPFLWRKGYWMQGINLVQQILPWAEVSKKAKLQAKCAHWLGRLFLYQGRYEEAEKYISTAVRLYSTSDWQWISVQTYLAQIFLRQGFLDKAYSILEEALPIALEPERNDRRGATRIHNAFAEIELYRNDLDAALEHVKIGNQLAQGVNEQSTVFGKNHHLHGIVEYRLNRFDGAELWINKYRDMAEREEFIQDVAQADLDLARIKIENGQINIAIEKARNARGIFERLGMKEQMEACDLLLSNIGMAEEYA